MIFLVFLLVVFVFAVRLIYDSLHQNFPEHELSGEDNLEEARRLLINSLLSKFSYGITKVLKQGLTTLNNITGQ